MKLTHDEIQKLVHMCEVATGLRERAKPGDSIAAVYAQEFLQRIEEEKETT